MDSKRFEKVMDASYWGNWNPGLDNGHLTLRDVFSTLPGVTQDEIDFVVWLCENPDSSFAFPGAVNLKNHDCIHIVLGRGLLNQDEAFVIGFTMGTAKEGITDEQVANFIRIAVETYRPPYQFSSEDILAFRLGFGRGVQSKVRRIFEINFDEMMDRKLSDIRGELGIDVPKLRAIYREERLLIPGSTSSLRLPE